MDSSEKNVGKSQINDSNNKKSLSKSFAQPIFAENPVTVSIAEKNAKNLLHKHLVGDDIEQISDFIHHFDAVTDQGSVAPGVSLDGLQLSQLEVATLDVTTSAAASSTVAGMSAAAAGLTLPAVGLGALAATGVAVAVTKKSADINHAPAIDTPAVTSSVSEQVAPNSNVIVQVPSNGNVTAHATPSGNVSSSGTVAFSDADNADTHTVSTAAVGVTLGTLTATIVTDTTNGHAGKIVWNYVVPDASIEYLAAGQTKVEHFTVTVDDGHGGAAHQDIAVTINGSNQAPVAQAGTNTATENAVPVTGTVHGTDVDDGATLTYSLNAPVAGLVINADGSYSFDPSNAAYQHLAAGATANVVAHFTVTDEHHAASSQTLTITVAGVNEAPVISSGTAAAAGAVKEDAASLTTTGTLTSSDVDDNATHAWSISGSNIGAYGSIAVDPGSGVWLYTLANGTNGVASPVQSLAEGQKVTDSFVLRITDEHGASADQTVTVTVTGTNDAPVARPDTFNIDGGQKLAISSAQILSNDTDIDTGDVLSSVGLIAQASHGLATFLSGGNYTYMPDAGFSGKDTFQYQINDGHPGGDATATVYIDVAQVQPAVFLDAPLTPVLPYNVINAAEERSFVLTGKTSGLGSDTIVTVTVADQSNDSKTVTAQIHQDGSWSTEAQLSGAALSALHDGTLTINASANSASAGTSATLSQYTAQLDTVALAPTLTLVTDSGASASDGITNVGVIHVAGVETGATWQYSTDYTSGGVAAATWAAGTGAGFTLSGDGVKDVVVQQTDSAGNVSVVSPALHFTLDTVALAPTLALATDSGSSASDGVTNVNVINVTDLETGAAYQYSTDYTSGGAAAATWATGTGSSFTLSGDGVKDVVVKQTDSAGNVSVVSPALHFTLDMTAPVIAVTDQVAQMGISFSYHAAYSDTGSGVASHSAVFTGKGEVLGLTISDSDSGFTVSGTPTGVGSEWVHVSATDVAGNVAKNDFQIASVSATVTGASATTTNNTLYQGSASNDDITVLANSGSVIATGGGDDVIRLNAPPANATFLSINGGAGSDTLYLSAAYHDVNLSQFNNAGQATIKHIETIQMSGSGTAAVAGGTVTLSAADLFHMQSDMLDGAYTALVIKGDASDTVATSGLTQAGGSFSVPGDTANGYAKYTGSVTENGVNHLLELLLQNSIVHSS